jgi:hypothetical protein
MVGSDYKINSGSNIDISQVDKSESAFNFEIGGSSTDAATANFVEPNADNPADNSHLTFLKQQRNQKMRDLAEMDGLLSLIPQDPEHDSQRSELIFRIEETAAEVEETETQIAEVGGEEAFDDAFFDPFA